MKSVVCIFTFVLMFGAYADSLKQSQAVLESKIANSKNIFELSEYVEKDGVIYPSQCRNKKQTQFCRKEKSIFTHSLIMSSLINVKGDHIIDKIKKDGVSFLESQKEKYGELVKYYRFENPLKNIVKYDTDDNSIINATLMSYGKDVRNSRIDELTNNAMIEITFNEYNGDRSFTGDVFTTWINPTEPLFKDIDVVIQSNALWLLGLKGISGNNPKYADACRYVNTVSEWVSDSKGWNDFYGKRNWWWLNHEQYSVWYPSPKTFIYSTLRAYLDGKQDCLKSSYKLIEEFLLNGVDFGDSLIEQSLTTASLMKLLAYKKEKGENISSYFALAKNKIKKLNESSREDFKGDNFYFYGAVGYVGSKAYELSLKIEANDYFQKAYSSNEKIDREEVLNKMQKSLSYFEGVQEDDGSFTKMIQVSSVFYNTFVIMLYEYTGILDENRDNAHKLMDYIFSMQNSDGGLSGYPDGPYEHDISLLAYLSARILGITNSDQRVAKLESIINKNGGIKKAKMRALFFLSLFGLTDLNRCLPSALSNVLLSLDSRLPWARVMIYPIYYLLSNDYIVELDESKRPFEIGKRKSVCRFLKKKNKINKKSEKKFYDWMEKFTAEDGTLFDYTPTSIFSLMAYSVHPEKYSDVFNKGVKTLQSFQVPQNGGLYQAPGEASIGETYVMLNALLDMGIDTESEIVKGSERFLYDRQLDDNGFAFSKNGTYFSDSDDTSNVIYVLQRLMDVRGESNQEKKQALDDAMVKLLTFQNRDGGYSTWEKKRFPLPSQKPNSGFLNRIPVLSESIAEHTSRIILNLDMYRAENEEVQKSYDKAIKWMLREQLKDGSWQGTWFVNYLFGTSMALVALATDHDNKKSIEAVEKGIRFLISHQNSDGGFSENLKSFEQSKVVKDLVSSPAQTGLIVSELLMFVRESNGKYKEYLKPYIEASVRFLVSTQNQNGLWGDKTFTGVTFPNVEYLYYPYIQDIEPMHVLGMYLKVYGE